MHSDEHQLSRASAAMHCHTYRVPRDTELSTQVLARDPTGWMRDMASVSPPRVSNASARCRFVVYMCYQPATMATPEDLALKRQAFDEHRVTTHWPAAGVCMPQEGSRDRKDFRWERTRHRVRAWEAMLCHIVRHLLRAVHAAVHSCTQISWHRSDCFHVSGHVGCCVRLHEHICRAPMRRELGQRMSQVEDPAVRRLAGVEAYPKQEIWTSRSLLDHTAEQLESMLRGAEVGPAGRTPS